MLIWMIIETVGFILRGVDWQIHRLVITESSSLFEKMQAYAAKFTSRKDQMVFIWDDIIQMHGLVGMQWISQK